MVLEMKKALASLKSGDSQGYRKIFDATCEEVYCRSLLILQDEAQAQEFTKDFYVDLFGMLDEADDAGSMEKWFWQKYYQKLRKQYHKLLEKQNKKSAGVRTLADMPASLPLLHRIMAVMSAKDDFTAKEISGIYGLPEEKVQAELEKLDKVLPNLTKGQPESVAAYLGSWKTLFLGASKQIASTNAADWDQMYQAAADKAGIAVEPAVRKDETFEYFVADVDLSSVKPAKKAVPIVEEEPEDDGYDDEDEYDDDEYEEEDDEYDDDEDYDDEDDEDDGRYDWDLEDDGRKMVILGIILALVILAVVGFGVSRILGGNDKKEQVQTEQEAEEGDAELIIKGDAPGEDEEEEEPVVEEPEESDEEEEEEVEADVMKMRVNGSSINVRSESNTNCAVLTQVNEGEEVEVLSDPSQEWVQIRCIEQNNEEGYVKAEYLDAIE